MGDQKEYYCPNPECGNMAFEPGVCSGCGAELIEAKYPQLQVKLAGRLFPGVVVLHVTCVPEG